MPTGRRLTTLAKEINEKLPGFQARIEEGYCNTDRKVGRLRVPGKGRRGNRLIVTDEATGEVVLDHNAAETYRHNSEVEAWLESRLREVEEANRKKSWKRFKKPV